MPIKWPESLVTELAERRCIIFAGAGVSVGSTAEDGRTHPPNWEKLLRGALPIVTKEVDRRYARSLIAQKLYLNAAEVIVDCSNEADFSGYLRQTLVEPRFSPSELHKTILEIDPKVFITTNYDQIYDNYCNSGKAAGGYNICRYYERFAVENLRSRTRLVIKAHGCVSDATRIILSRSSYYEARRDYPGFYKVLDGLFLTNTLLFVGCSLTDPDIQLVLENANISAPSSHPHYSLVEKTHHRSIKASIKTTHNIELLEYPKGKHQDAIDAMSSLRDRVIEIRNRLGVS